MKRLSLFVIGITMTSLAISQTASPELVCSAGDSFNNTSYQLSWSIGECIGQTHTQGAYVLTQGFHQDNYVITAVENLHSDINITIYPNPTTDFVSLDFKTTVGLFDAVTVIDINGKILQQVEVTSNKEYLDLSNYANGVYFLSVKQGTQLIKTFKIIKN